MLLGRTEELNQLNEEYTKADNSLVMLYGRSDIGKTSLIKEFAKDKRAFYYAATNASEKGQIELLTKELKAQGLLKEETGSGDYMETSIDEEKMELPLGDNYAVYAHLIKNTSNLEGSKKLIVIEEFQNIVKNNKEFMAVIEDLVKGKFYREKVMVIITSSSVSWVENSMVTAIGVHAMAISRFIKLKELSFVDIVRMFPHYTVLDDTVVYAITGGVPGYLVEFSDKLPLRENVVSNILKSGRKLRTAGNDYIKEELRETSLYDTILYCIAGGENKLNELHLHTGFGRDKISVYLKNLMDREVVEKVFSYDIGGKEYTRKGLYRIKSGYTEFWFRYIYPNESALNMMDAEEFYDRYIAASIYEFAREAFVKVGTEFIELMDSMGRLEISINRQGRWWGKNGDIDIIACDTEDRYLIGKCNWETDTFTFQMFEELLSNAELANVGKDYIYLFSKNGFDSELRSIARDSSNLKLVSLNDL